jgi:hypothetical protein
MFKSFKLWDVNHDEAWHSNNLERGYFFQFCGCKYLVNFAKNQKVNENCTAKTDLSRISSKNICQLVAKICHRNNNLIGSTNHCWRLFEFLRNCWLVFEMLQTQRTTSSSSLKKFKIKDPVIFMKVLAKNLGFFCLVW